MVGFDIRPMKGPDVARVAEIERICFITPWSYESLYKELKNKFAHYLVIEINGNIVGYGGMWVYLGEAHVTNIAVEPEFRRRGLARILMQSMMLGSETLRPKRFIKALDLKRRASENDTIRIRERMRI